MSIQEKDCRRCKELDGEETCHNEGANFKPDVQLGCVNFTPISGHDCRNCGRFNGKDESCEDHVGGVARDFKLACDSFKLLSTSIKPKLKPSPTILTYQFKDEDDSEDPVRITKGDKILSLENIWKDKPCDDIYNRMVIVFLGNGFNIDTEIPFTQGNLSLLTDTAFGWLLDYNFFTKAEEEKVVYEVGQWFNGYDDTYYVLCKSIHPPGVTLMNVGGPHCPYSECTPGFWTTTKEANDAIGHTCWEHLKPVDPPIKS